MPTFGMSSLWVALISPLMSVEKRQESVMGPWPLPLPLKEVSSKWGPGYHPQCTLGVPRGLPGFIQSDLRRVWGCWSQLSLSWTPKSSEVKETRGTPSSVCVPQTGGMSLLTLELPTVGKGG